MKLGTKRAYEEPDKRDGARILVDRLWPRGVSKRAVALDEWRKDLAPSDALRKWYHADKDARWPEFRKRYLEELSEKKGVVAEFRRAYGRRTVTLVTAAKDVERSHVPVLMARLAPKK